MEQTTTTILCGDAREKLKELPDKSVQMCVTSPPYFALRCYGGGQLEIGIEQTPAEYIHNLVDVFREVKRVLKDDGTLWLNIGDSYWGSGSRGTDFTKHDTWNGTINKGNRGTADLSLVPKLVGRFGDIKNKDMIGIPWMLAFALREDGWYLRQDIIWAKRNCMPESVTDRCTRSHEYVFLLSKKPKYYYDYKAIQEPTVTFDDTIQYDTRNKRDVWSIATVPFSGAHFATFPEELVKPCILAGSRTGDTVLDPFNGAGTTGVVCVKLGRNYIGTELNPEYVEMAKKRIADTRLELEYGIIAGQEKKDTFEYESSLFDEMSSETA